MGALDDLIDTLGEPEETNKDDSWYTGPVVLVCNWKPVRIHLQWIGKHMKL